MTDKSRGALAVERTADGRYEWVITLVEHDIGTLPRQERSSSAYATEQEARQAGESRMESLRD